MRCHPFPGIRLGPIAFAIAMVGLPTGAPAEPVLEEIIVTATKRSESMQSVPLSVSSISGEELRERGLTEFFDYAVTIPNLSFGAATDGILSNRTVSLRGIEGTNTTGYYIDDTPVTETIDPRILDLERIEVLRGPSGTLYGARSLGGTIRQITRRPDFERTGGWARAELSSTGHSDDLNYLVAGSFNAPFNDQVAARFSGLFEERAGVFDRRVGAIANHLAAPATLAGPPSSVIEDVDQQQVAAVQAHLLVEPSDDLSIAARILHQKTDLDGFPLADVTTGNFDHNRDFDVDEGGDDKWTLYTLNVNYAMDQGTFTSATSWFERETFETEASGAFINFLQALPGEAGGFGLFDVIGVRPITSPIFQTLNFKTFVQEARFASDLDGAWNFVAGAFYQNTDDDEAFQPRNYARGLNDNFAALQQTLGIPGPLEAIWPFGDLVFTSYRPTGRGGTRPVRGGYPCPERQLQHRGRVALVRHQRRVLRAAGRSRRRPAAGRGPTACRRSRRGRQAERGRLHLQGRGRIPGQRRSVLLRFSRGGISSGRRQRHHPEYAWMPRRSRCPRLA